VRVEPRGDTVIELAAEVRDAVDSGRAIVALETTLVAHGFPSGEGVEVGLAAEQAVRDAGAVPATIGVLDGDITGPSIPKMFGVREKPPVAADGKSLVPPRSRGGIPIMSMNLLLPEEGEAVIWRGPMVSGAIRQFFSDVQWGELDYLIVDLPPGTSDAPLTVMQALPVDGVVLVTTPQALAAMVVTKAVKLVKQLGGDILGIVENMSYVRVPDGSTIEVFGPSQGLKLVIASNAPLIAKLPIDPEIARLSDAGLIESYESPESEELIVNFLERAPEKHPQVPVA